MQPTIALLKTTFLNGFPSGSAINYHDDNLYLIGDDANHLLVLDKDHRQLNAVRIANHQTKRIPKAQKPDFETAAIIHIKDKTQLLVIGSASTEARKQALLIPIINKLPDIKQLVKLGFYNEAFLTELKVIGIKEVNVEGSTVMDDYFLISNRGNLANPVNHIIFINKDFLQTQKNLSLFMSALLLPPSVKGFAGVSELCYIGSKDMLFCTLSSEETANTYDDGAIGDSYIGWINHFSKKIRQPNIAFDEMINLSNVHQSFIKEKIEGICAEAVYDDHLIMHLVADNDKGQTRLFKIKVLL
jgi:hypothetical protein